MSERRIVILTGVSGSWKTTLQEELLKTGKWERPLNCTTRESRWDYELDEYLFLTKEQFFFKLEKWDFLEHTNYWWNWYWVCASLRVNTNIIIILDPIGREMASEFFIRNGIKFETYFLQINPDEQENRLIKRGDSKVEIVKRRNDFKWFSPTPQCKILSGNNTTECLLRLIDNE